MLNRVAYCSVLAKRDTEKYSQKESVSVAKIAVHQRSSGKPEESSLFSGAIKYVFAHP